MRSECLQLGISLSDAELAFLIHKYGAGGSVFDWAAFCRVYDDWHSRMETTYGTLFNATLTRRPLYVSPRQCSAYLSRSLLTPVFAVM